MECQICVEENKKSIETKGYGYGYIGNRFDCKRHPYNPRQQTPRQQTPRQQTPRQQTPRQHNGLEQRWYFS
jgi:hypothetical protein